MTLTTLTLERGRDIAEVELLATCLLGASYIVRSALDIAYVRSMSVRGGRGEEGRSPLSAVS